MRPLPSVHWLFRPDLAPTERQAAGRPLPRSLYAFIWRRTGRDQVLLSALTLLVVPLSLAPLELQRLMVNSAIGGRDTHLLLVLGLSWLAVVLVQGGLKYVLNLRRGRVVEAVARELRLQAHASVRPGARWAVPGADATTAGVLVSMASAEAEEVAGFVAESVSTPLLQGGTIVAVIGYMTWVQPLIAGFALLLYLPELVVVPWRQWTINRLARAHTHLVRRLGADLVVQTVLGGRSHDHGAGFRGRVDRAYATRLAIYRSKYALTFLGNLLDALGPIGVLVLGGWLVTQGQATVGALVAFIAGFQKVGDPLDQLMVFYRTTQNAFVKYDLIVTALAHLSPRDQPAPPEDGPVAAAGASPSPPPLDAPTA
jgi:ABC-type bacteriocin/lantibiotic exporter with double-glycine peptidase domain